MRFDTAWANNGTLAHLEIIFWMSAYPMISTLASDSVIHNASTWLCHQRPGDFSQYVNIQATLSSPPNNAKIAKTPITIHTTKPMVTKSKDAYRRSVKPNNS